MKGSRTVGDNAARNGYATDKVARKDWEYSWDMKWFMSLADAKRSFYPKKDQQL